MGKIEDESRVKVEPKCEMNPLDSFHNIVSEPTKLLSLSDKHLLR